MFGYDIFIVINIMITVLIVTIIMIIMIIILIIWPMQPTRRKETTNLSINQSINQLSSFSSLSSAVYIDSSVSSH